MDPDGFCGTVPYYVIQVTYLPLRSFYPKFASLMKRCADLAVNLKCWGKAVRKAQHIISGGVACFKDVPDFIFCYDYC